MAGAAADKSPDIGVKTAGLFLDIEKGPGILHRRLDLEPIPHDAGVGQQPFDLAGSVAGNASGLEVVKRGPVVGPLLENRIPTQTGLSTLQDEKLEQGPVVVNGDAPLPVVVLHGQRIRGPAAPNKRRGGFLSRRVFGFNVRP